LSLSIISILHSPILEVFFDLLPASLHSGEVVDHSDEKIDRRIVEIFYVPRPDNRSAESRINSLSDEDISKRIPSRPSSESKEEKLLP
jgi:hypothetical protein